MKLLRLILALSFLAFGFPLCGYSADTCSSGGFDGPSSATGGPIPAFLATTGDYIGRTGKYITDYPEWEAATKRTWKTVKENWATTVTNNLRDLKSYVWLHYRSLIATQIPGVECTDITWTDTVRSYPNNPIYKALAKLSGSPEAQGNEILVPLRRLEISFRTKPGDDASQRKLVAYYANYNVNVGSRFKKVIFQINGHCYTAAHSPSRIALGLDDPTGSNCNESAAVFAVLGFPVIIYDDYVPLEKNEKVESTQMPGAADPDSLYQTLLNLRVVDELLLSHFDQVDGVGLSGGSERLFHFLVLHGDDVKRKDSWYNKPEAKWRRPKCVTTRCNLRSAYFAGIPSSRWSQLDGSTHQGHPFGCDSDTANLQFDTNFQYADLALFGIASGIRVGISMNEADDGDNQWFYSHEFKPSMLRFTHDFHIGGNDPDGLGPNPECLCPGVFSDRVGHDYEWHDYFIFARGLHSVGASR